MGRIVDPDKICIYCGNHVGRIKDGEHVIPKALGCELTIKTVCGRCNNRLGTLDNELISKSPLRLLARLELQDHMGDGWMRDPVTDLAVRCRIVGEFHHQIAWPQAIYVGGKRWEFYADPKDLNEVGHDIYFVRFRELVKGALHTLQAGHKRPRLRWQEVRIPPIEGKCPPRILTPHLFKDFGQRITFTCLYVQPFDKQRFLHELDKWLSKPPSSVGYGESKPGKQIVDGTNFDARVILRGFVKIGLNLLAYVCNNTVVNRDTFREAIDFVLEDKGAPPRIQSSGFVINSDVYPDNCPAHAHKFCLMHTGMWHLYCSFFGGRLGARVLFPGDNYEDWNRVEFTAPIGKKFWPIPIEHRTVVAVKQKIEWMDTPRLIPSIPFTFHRAEKKAIFRKNQ